MIVRLGLESRQLSIYGDHLGAKHPISIDGLISSICAPLHPQPSFPNPREWVTGAPCSSPATVGSVRSHAGLQRYLGMYTWAAGPRYLPSSCGSGPVQFRMICISGVTVTR